MGVEESERIKKMNLEQTIINRLFGHEIDVAKQGVEASIQYLAYSAKLTEWAISTVNLAALQDVDLIAEAFVAEALSEGSIIKTEGIDAVLTNSDPFAGSRHLLQVAIAKWGPLGFTKDVAILTFNQVKPAAPTVAPIPTTPPPVIPNPVIDEPTSDGGAFTPQ
jgi:hypothetical protein